MDGMTVAPEPAGAPSPPPLPPLPRAETAACTATGVTQSASLDRLYTALAAVHSELANPTFNKVANVETRKGGFYQFAFANLPHILRTVRPILARHGLLLTQIPTTLHNEDGSRRQVLITRLAHVSGQFMQAELPLPPLGQMNIQDWGSNLTYVKRYEACAILAIAADNEDDDGNRAAGNRAEFRDYGEIDPREDDGGGAGQSRPSAPPPRQAPLREARRANPAPTTGQTSPDFQRDIEQLRIELVHLRERGGLEQDGIEVWLGKEHALREMRPVTLRWFVRNYRRIFGTNPPPVEGLVYAAPDAEECEAMGLRFVGADDGGAAP